MWQFPAQPLKRPRDQQQSRIYAAEKEIRETHWGREIPDVQDVQVWVRKVCNSAWMKKNFGEVLIKVRDGRGFKKATAYGHGGKGTIYMPKWSRWELVILHEIAHVLTPYKFAAHGPEWCRVFLALTERFLGQEIHDQLKGAFRRQEVNFLR